MRKLLLIIIILNASYSHSQELKGIRIGDYCSDCEGEDNSNYIITTVAGISGILSYNANYSGKIYGIQFESDKKINFQHQQLLDEINFIGENRFPTTEQRNKWQREINERNESRKSTHMDYDNADRMKGDIEDYYRIKLIQKIGTGPWESRVNNTIYRFEIRPKATFTITDTMLKGIYEQEQRKRSKKLREEESAKRKSDF